MDFTPLLAQVQANGALSDALLEGTRVVVCLGSRAQISFLVSGGGNDGRIVGAATTEAEGLALVERLRPDVLFASDGLEEGCGVDLVVTVKQRLEGIRTLLMIEQLPRRHRIRAAIDCGCDGILLESQMAPGAWLDAVRTVSSGGLYLDRSLGEALVAGRESGGGGRLRQALSLRERDVLARLVRGESNADIAAHLVVSVDTVKTHLRNLLLKLHARDRTHAAVLGLQLGLVDWPEPDGGR